MTNSKRVAHQVELRTCLWCPTQALTSKARWECSKCRELHKAIIANFDLAQKLVLGENLKALTLQIQTIRTVIHQIGENDRTTPKTRRLLAPVLSNCDNLVHSMLRCDV